MYTQNNTHGNLNTKDLFLLDIICEDQGGCKIDQAKLVASTCLSIDST